MLSYEDLKKQSDEELLQFMSSQCQAQAGSVVGAQEARNRELAKAILDHRSSEITRQHNQILIWLTRLILVFTIIVAVLTIVLVFKG